MGATVLIADDSAVIRAVLRHHLEEEGYRVEVAVDGPGTIEMMRRHQPDMVLLDIVMPGLDGREVLSRVKADEALQDTPIVFLTSRTGRDDIVAALRAGAQDYLKKPFELAELIARVGAAVRTKRLQDALRQRSAELEAMTRTDALTGVFNRRHLDEELWRFVRLASRHGDSVAVVLLDIDTFKQIDDTYGREAGDAVLKEFALRVRAALRAEDIVGRWGDAAEGKAGGEQFLLLLPQTDIDGACLFGERVRSAIAAAPFPVGDCQIEITVSGGCAAGAEPPVELVRRAEAALHQAKEAGCNRLVAADSPPTTPVPAGRRLGRNRDAV
ncbi:MAG: diguanylate cyclase [Actinobacteria bacterium]|nr:MAG: diguanylate cyclase [Actinomycetota bacterium]